ncbi:hypothetical protein ACFL4T_07625 [candidate division KSB1 bacterium]
MEKEKNRKLSWEKTYMFRKVYELSEDSKKVAELKRKSIFSADASGEIGNSRYLFESYGSFNRSLRIRNSVNNEKTGSIDLNWLGNNNGILELTSGQKYTWKCLDFFRGKWAWLDDAGNEIVTFHPKGLINKNGTVYVTAGENSRIDHDLLVLFGLHLKLFFNYWIIIIAVVIFAVLKD